MKRVMPCACPLLAVVMLLSMSISGHAAEQKGPTPPAAQAPSAPTAIPLTEVAARATAVLTDLPSLAAQLAISPQIHAIVIRLPEVSEGITKDLAEATQLLRGQPSLGMIAAQQQMWKARQLQTTTWLTLLTARASQLQATLDQLANLQATWRRTDEAAQSAKAPVAILQQIESVLKGIQNTEIPFQTQRATVLDLQSRVAQEVARCGTALALFAGAEKVAMGGMLTQDTPPIWSAEQWKQARATYSARIVDVSIARWETLVEYAKESSTVLPLQVASVALLLIVTLGARRRVREWTAAGEWVSPATKVFDRPFAAALVLPLLYVASPYAAVPATLRQLFEVLGLVPVLRLIWPVVDRRAASGFSTVALLFTLDTIRQDYAGTPGFEQAILGLEMLAGIATLAYALTRGELRRAVGLTAASARLQTLHAGAMLLLATFSVTLVAGVFGYIRLARLLASAVIGSGALGMTLYAGLLVLTGLAAVSLRVWPVRLLKMVRDHRDLLNRRISVVLGWATVLAWAVRTLDYIGLLPFAVSFVTTVLSARLQRGSMSISLGDVLDFFLTVWVAYLLSAFIRFVLAEDVYPRIHLPRGISYAVSSLLSYLFVAGGFVLGLGALGMDLSKVTILAGAFGVGIGFGLQNVVNNFVSGLILLFERPIHVGDVIHMDDLFGEVRRIGIRASVVRTWQGAEIIVPNAQLVAERVTNWTLSDRRRRIDLPIGVSYGVAPTKVVELLESVARAHPQALQDPAPRAFCTGFGDSAINYELRVWTDDFAQWVQIQSELAASVYTALKGAGMAIPFPQREVRLLRDGPDAAGVTPAASQLSPSRSEGIAESGTV